MLKYIKRTKRNNCKLLFLRNELVQKHQRKAYLAIAQPQSNVSYKVYGGLRDQSERHFHCSLTQIEKQSRHKDNMPTM